MLEQIFPLSFKATQIVKLTLLCLLYLAVPIFIGIVGGLASAVPYVNILMTVQTVLVSVYCAGGILVAILFFFEKL